jgi:hypothetical protein
MKLRTRYPKEWSIVVKPLKYKGDIMNIAIISATHSQFIIKETTCVPSVGNKVDLFKQSPMPKVTEVCWWPRKELVQMLPKNIEVDVVVFVV